MNKYEVFNAELSTITNDDIRDFAKELLNNAFDYFYQIPASSSGKYHPKTSLGCGGLVRHTKSVVRFLNHFLSLEQYVDLFTDREMDLMRIACLMHDSEKNGRNNSQYTVTNHPLFASETIQIYKGEYLTDSEIDFIASSIETHMGQWNKGKSGLDVLPKPSTKAHELVHLADYLASRRDIEVEMDDYVKDYESLNIDEYRFVFGKHEGELLTEVAVKDKSYIDWLKENVVQEPLKSLLTKI